MLFVRVVGIPGAQGSKTLKGTYRDKRTGAMRGRMVEASKKVEPWRQAVTAAIVAAREKNPIYFEGAVRLTLEFIMVRPKAMSVKRPTPWHDKTPDLDKLCRATNDAITISGVWRDDSCVCSFGALEKRYAEPGEPTGCTIIIEALPPKSPPKEKSDARKPAPRRGGARAKRKPAAVRPDDGECPWFA